MDELEQYASSMFDQIEKIIPEYYATEIKKNFDDIVKFNKKYSQNDIKIVFELLINKYLFGIKQILKNNSQQKITKVSILTSYFSEKIDDVIMSDVQINVEELLDKLLEVNKRSLTFPFNINYFEEYAITSSIDSKKINLTLKLITLTLALQYYNLKYNIN